MPDYYEILEVQESSTLAEIKKSYRTLSMKWHPDRNKEPHAETKFKTINEAYETLGDEEKRRLYDETRKNHHVPQNVHTHYYTYQPPATPPPQTRPGGFCFYNETYRSNSGSGMDQETIRRILQQQFASSFFSGFGNSFSDFKVYSNNGVHYQSYRMSR